MRSALREGRDPIVPGRLSREELLSLLLPPEVRDHVPESQLIELLADIVNSRVGERDHADSSRPSSDDVGDQVQDGLGLTCARRPLDDRNRTGEAVLDRFPLTEVAAER